MVAKKYIPDQGDLVWLDFDPRRGHEQSGRRPAFVVSKKEYNQKSGLALVCPITSVRKGYPFEVEVITKKIKGYLLVDQVRTVDWFERGADFLDLAHAGVVEAVQELLYRLIE
ncbi:MAG: type II toxin-antitoxin system PemK/MazF family toxin [Candidatus Vogelbacteria bacterium]|nr:type II toxin-antitoxin system PemK/MazF family toxin [Candidatus Vogelbacteria bacterium]